MRDRCARPPWEGKLRWTVVVPGERWELPGPRGKLRAAIQWWDEPHHGGYWVSVRTRTGWVHRRVKSLSAAKKLAWDLLVR